MRRPILWTTRWSALLSLSVLVLAPTAAHSRDDPVARLDARFVDFQPIDAYVTSQMQAMHIPGVGLGIVHGDEIVHLRGFGVANPAGQLMTAHTPVVLGSTSKSFTALAIMQLVEARSNCIFNGLVGIARQGSADNLACGDTARVVEQMADS